MRRAQIVGWLLISLLALAACRSRPPDISVATTRYDFGAIQQGEVVVAEISVRNAGQGELKIEAVSTSCGCTTARVEPEVIPPGGEGRLIVQYNSGAHPDSGAVQRYVYIASNDPDEPEVQVIITAEVQAPAS